MDSQQAAELSFWRDLYRQLGHEGFLAQRVRDRERALSYLPGLVEEQGRGLDMGCGLWSIFEGWGRDVDAYDPLLDEYNRILPADLAREVVYIPATADLPSDIYDWVTCINVADHAASPVDLMIEIYRLLKPSGRLYFQVNMDPVLTATHYKLWREHEIRGYLHLFRLITEQSVRGEYDGQWQYWGVYRCEK